MKYVIGNWKMNGNTQLLKQFLGLGEEGVVLCVPFHLLGIDTGNLNLGAEDCSIHDNGAFTGEISAEMIKETGAKYCIVGHSERRQYFGETNEFVAKKAAKCLANEIIPIICVGETKKQRESGQTLSVIEDQVWQSIPSIEQITSDIIVAYEPVWAIGTGLVPTLDDVSAVHNLIAGVLKKMGLARTAILYGGSVKPNNAKEIMEIENVGGVLVGGAALDASIFKEIINARK